jgi:hypothetical protein
MCIWYFFWQLLTTMSSWVLFALLPGCSELLHYSVKEQNSSVMDCTCSFLPRMYLIHCTPLKFSKKFSKYKSWTWKGNSKLCTSSIVLVYINWLWNILLYLASHSCYAASKELLCIPVCMLIVTQCCSCSIVLWRGNWCSRFAYFSQIASCMHTDYYIKFYVWYNVM